MYSISEVAKKIGVSRQSIYKKIDRPELQEYLQDSDKGKLINEKGFHILKGLFGEYLDSKQVTDNEPLSNSKKHDNLQPELTADYIASLKAEIDHLKGIISDQTQQNANLTRLLENSQVLQKQQQEKILLLEESTAKQRSFWSFLKRV